MERFDVIISGVGGQGTVLASRILAAAALASGLDARTAETIGMAQREGCVLSHVRMGDSPVGPLVAPGGASALIAFEPAEAVRALPFLKPHARAVINKRAVVPVTVALGQSEYDAEVVTNYIRKRIENAVMVDAAAAAQAVGGLRYTNVVMLGVAFAAGILPVSGDALLSAVRELVPSRYVEQNIRAFKSGEALVSR